MLCQKQDDIDMIFPVFTACLFLIIFCCLFFSDDSREGIELQRITSTSRDLINENNEQPRDERFPEIQRFAYPLDRPAADGLARFRPRSLSEDLGSVSDISLIISPGVPEEPCPFSDETPLEEGSGPTAFG